MEMEENPKKKYKYDIDLAKGIVTVDREDLEKLLNQLKPQPRKEVVQP